MEIEVVERNGDLFCCFSETDVKGLGAASEKQTKVIIHIFIPGNQCKYKKMNTAVKFLSFYSF